MQIISFIFSHCSSVSLFILSFATTPLYCKYYEWLDFTQLILFKEDLSFVELMVCCAYLQGFLSSAAQLGAYNKIRLSLTGDLAKLHLFLADNSC